MPLPELTGDLSTADLVGLFSSTGAYPSPLGLELGEFLTEDNFDFIADFIGNYQNGPETF